MPSSAACGRQLPPKGKPLELTAAPRGMPLELKGAFSPWGRRCPRPRPRTDEGRACGCCPLKGDHANFALISRLRAAASPEGEAFKETAMKGIKTHDPLRTNAQKLRRKMTPQERRLWYDFLKNLPQTVYRQKIIGNFIVDFYISSCKLVIELDGAQHTEPQAVEYDAQRTAYLQGIGCRVLRYANNAVDTNFAGVCEDILHNIG